MFFLLFSLFYALYCYFWFDGAKLRINFQSAKCFRRRGACAPDLRTVHTTILPCPAIGSGAAHRSSLGEKLC